MSRGIGRIQREIDAIMIANPDGAFTVQELAVAIYKVPRTLEQKRHRVAVIRAAEGLCEIRPELGMMYGSRGKVALYHRRSLLSYGIAKEKSHFITTKFKFKFLGDEYWNERVAGHPQLREGGDWWIAVHEWIAERDNNEELRAKVKAFKDAKAAKKRADYIQGLGMMVTCGSAEERAEAVAILRQMDAAGTLREACATLGNS